ncbi:MAG: transketolase [Pirellulales bacterium]|nr:transketolase [Pirellulales bacterium]
MADSSANLDQLAIDTIRTLAMDAVEQAKSGHPGTPMALAPVAFTLWNEFLAYDPAHPLWPGRDRFVLSCGHASMLLYALLHLAGARQTTSDGRTLDEPAVPLAEIRRFRQLGSRCPGHPEHGLTGGVETTTGPLGQGVGNSVGMAIAQRWLAAHFHRPGCELWNYRVWALCSDGDLMEGISHEAASLAGHLKLASLCWIYDDNRITIEGKTDLAYSDRTAERFAAYGWDIIELPDANDLHALRRAYARVARSSQRPTLIVVRSHIAYGAPNKQDTHDAHGAPLGSDEIALTKAAYHWPPDAQFLVPAEVIEHMAAGLGARGARLHAAWSAQFASYAREFPELAERWRLMNKRQLPQGWDTDLPVFPASGKGDATRNTSGKALNAIAKRVPWLLGGSADLAPSTKTLIAGEASFSADNPVARNLHFGIREHGMAAALNGMALSGLRPYGATFLVFSDYCRPSIRLAAIMELPVVYVFTHDSIGVGEDGPTHEPIEHLAALRSIPNLLVMRPADANEVSQCWRAALLERARPVALVLTRQNVPTFDRDKLGGATGVARGAYVLADPPSGQPAVILMATGSEVSLCVAAYEQLLKAGVPARVVSMPCWELFDEQPTSYRHEILPPGIKARVGVEAGIEQGWRKYLGSQGRFIGMHGYGASAPADVLFEHFGLTPAHVVSAARASLEH